MYSTPISLLMRIRTRSSAEAWNQLVELYTPLLLSWAKKLEPHDQDAADLVQEVFVIMIEKLPHFTYNPELSFRAWLKTFMLNGWRRHRVRGRRVQQAGEGILEDILESDPRLEIEEQEYRHHLVARALQLMRASIESTTWQACWRYVVEEQSPEQVATELGISINAVYLAKSRVLRQLRSELQGMLD